MNFIVCIAVCLSLLSTGAFGQANAVTSAREFRIANELRLLQQFVELLSIPNVASDTPDIIRNSEYLIDMMRKRGLNPRALTLTDKTVPPAVYGEWITPGAKQTIIFYAHYDGQPVDLKAWTVTPPFTPVIFDKPFEKGGKALAIPNAGEKIDPEWRLYGRSASDDKAGVFAILTALEALNAKGIKPTVNIRFLFEGEEEAGSPHLGEILDRNKDLLKADAFIVCDGPVHQSGRKEVVFGVRGDSNVDLTVYGANRPLHSGHYGNWSPNPALLLAKLLASMKDDRGNIVIKGWNDDIEPLARNVIPTTANAVLDLRLVKGNDFLRQFQKLKTHIESQGFYVVDRDPTEAERMQHPLIAKLILLRGAYNAQRTRMDLPISLRVIDAVQRASKDTVVRMPTLGGSLPLSIISDALNIPTITVPIANYDNNQHAENENIRLQNLWNGIEIYASLMTMKAN